MINVDGVDSQCWQSVWMVSVGSQCGWSVLAVSAGGQCWQSVWVVSVDSEWSVLMVWMVIVDGQC